MTPVPDGKPPTLIGDLKEIQRYGSLVLLFASIPAIGLPGLVAKLLHLDDVIGLWQLIAATAPLTAAATVVGIVLRGEKVEPAYMILAIPFSLLGSLFLGLLLGDELPLGKVTNFQLVDFSYTILSAYFRHYGAWSFATSLLVGALLSWAWSRKLWPRLASVVDRPAGPKSPDRDPSPPGHQD